MSQNVKLKPVSTIEAGLGIDPNGAVQLFFTQTCAHHMDKYVPFDKGTLAKYKIYGNDTIAYEQPYAHYMYVGKVMGPNIPIKVNGVIIRWFSKKPKYYTGADMVYNTSKHKEAGPYWDQRMVSAEGKDVVKEVQDYAKKRW